MIAYTPSQTAGPYSHLALMRAAAQPASALDPHPEADADLDATASGTLVIEGRIVDGEGRPVDDAVLEIWSGGAGLEICTDLHRVETDEAGQYTVTVVRPEAALAAAPHLDVLIHAGGLNRYLLTRIYLPGEPANKTDPVLQQVEATRRSTLIATEGDAGLRFDIRLQGDDETVFFDV